MPGAGEGKRWGVSVYWGKVSAWEHEKVLEVMVVAAAAQYEVLNATEPCT